ncbi:DUF2306 domain-containing protein [Aliiglaciecola sp. M165]|uniref:DUF2306 domain-containing protein n=1 Tax=Aliiglaciecola sp. M165 TaxID=2593649 RepID=UPI00117C76A8|nr:DUF2306 domain-containing protein [Aliiglaciecola sp. M165]TRY33172.1 DUF2306 domain-containing protein [Aliiglaciecola sp. M165]
MAFILFIHVVFGTAAVILGFFSLTSKKGAKAHRLVGKGYVLTMLIMAASGLLAALIKSQIINVFAALLTCYLVLTAWHAATSKRIIFDKWVITPCLSILLVGLCAMAAGLMALDSVDNQFAGFSHVAYFFIGGIALLGGLLDSYILLKNTLSEKQRLVRHIWRMTFSYFIAAGSLFTGPGASAFPESIRNSGVLGIPEPLILIVMLFFIAKTFLQSKKTKRA